MEAKCSGFFTLYTAYLIMMFFHQSETLPLVDPGVFVLQGVPTCRRGEGYCLLGLSCSIDKDFAADDEGGHCQGLTQSFTSTISFVCCKYVNDGLKEVENYETTLSSFTVPDDKFQLLDEHPIDILEEDENEIHEDIDPTNVINIVGVITDRTGILGFITKPYVPPTTPTPFLTNAASNESIILSISMETTTKIDAEKEPTTEEAVTVVPMFREVSDSYNEIPISFNFLNLANEIQNSTPTLVETKNNEEDNTHKGQKMTLRKEEHITHSNMEEIPTSVNSPTLAFQSTDETSTELADIYNTYVEPVTTFNLDESNIPLIDNFNLNYANLEKDFKNQSSTLHLTTESPLLLLSFTQMPVIEQRMALTTKSSLLVPLYKRKNLATTKIDHPVTEMYVFETTETHADKKLEDQKYGSSYLHRLNDSIMTENTEQNIFDDVMLPHPVNLNVCGLKNENLQSLFNTGRLKNVQMASTYEWCWSAALMKKGHGNDRFECSGALIELDLVMTTAACLKRLKNKDLYTYRIVLGDSNLRDGLPYSIQYHDILEIVTHPDYLTSGGAHSNDIGLIRLKDFATVSDNVCMICVPQNNADLPSEKCVVSGYTTGPFLRALRQGFSNFQGYSTPEGTLRQAPVTLAGPSECLSSLKRISPNPNLAINPRTLICDAREKSARSCLNALDGGSPLVCEVGGRWFLAGIKSWSQDCSSEPNVYTKVSEFSDWFLQTRLRMYGFPPQHKFNLFRRMGNAPLY